MANIGAVTVYRDEECGYAVEIEAYNNIIPINWHLGNNPMRPEAILRRIIRTAQRELERLEGA